MIWARGQRADVYYHRPAAGIDNPNIPLSDPNYYKRDELKYHGNNQDNNHRGRTTVNFFGSYLRIRLLHGIVTVLTVL